MEQPIRGAADTDGDATNGEVDLGVLVRSTGVVDAFHGGAAAGRGRAHRLRLRRPRACRCGCW